MEQKTSEQIVREDPRARNDNRERIPVATVRGPRTPQKVGFIEKLRAAQVSKKGAVGLMIAAAVLTMIIGFNWGEWITGGTSRERITAGAQDAVTARLIPICVAQFNLDPQKTVKLAEFKAITSSWERSDYVKKQGWATMPGEASPDSDVASACAKLLMDN